jgi:hypothetical protein
MIAGLTLDARLSISPSFASMSVLALAEADFGLPVD